MRFDSVRTQMSKSKPTERWWVGNYRHAQPAPKANLYWVLRNRLGLTQRKAAALYGVSIQAWRYRERWKRMYHLGEILALHDMSGMSWSEFSKLLNDCA
jgi:hypothetical protein